MSWFADIARSFLGGAIDESLSSGSSFYSDKWRDDDEKPTEEKTDDVMRRELGSGFYAEPYGSHSYSYIGNQQDPVDHDESSSAGGAAHSDGHVSPGPHNQPTGESTGGLIKDVLEHVLNGELGSAARDIAESQVVQDAAGATAEVVVDALHEIGESLTKDQP